MRRCISLLMIVVLLFVLFTDNLLASEYNKALNIKLTLNNDIFDNELNDAELEKVEGERYYDVYHPQSSWDLLHGGYDAKEGKRIELLCEIFYELIKLGVKITFTKFYDIIKSLIKSGKNIYQIYNELIKLNN